MTASALTVALSLKAVHKKIANTEIIRGVSLDIYTGECHALIGPNGAGKSTLFNLMSGRSSASCGSITLNGSDITHKKPDAINRLGLSRSFQITYVFNNLSVFENVRCAVLWGLGYQYSFWQNINKTKDASDAANQMLLRIGLDNCADTPAGLLSYAEQRALEIAMTVVGGAKVILLDEPTAGMSRSESADIVKLIRTLTQDKTLVIVEHDMRVVFELADRISVLVYGEIIATDTPLNIRNNRSVQIAYLGEDNISKYI